MTRSRARYLAWTVPANLVGGGVLVGLGYVWLGGTSGGSAVDVTQSAGDGATAEAAEEPVRIEVVGEPVLT